MGIKVDTTTLDPQTNLQTPEASTGTGIKVDDTNSVYIPQTLFYDSMNFTNTYSDPMSDYTKYGVVPTRFTDWDEMRARNQSTGEKWVNGLTKAGVTTLGAIAENTLGVLFGIGEVIGGGTYYDNVIGNTVDKANDWMRENMPNYLTQAERENTTMQKLGTANFWADTVANGLGYSLGSVATIALTGGVGILSRTASATAKAARSLGIYNTAKNIANSTKVAQQMGKKASSFLKPTSAGIKNSLRTIEAGLMMSMAEASVEARETQRNTYDDLIQMQIEDPTNNINSINDFSAKELEDIEHASYAAGNRNFLTQLPILAGTNLIMFGKSVAGFRAARNYNKDVSWDAAAFKAVSNLEGRSRYRNALSRMKPTATGTATEVAQEGWQFASNVFSSDYHTNKYFNGGTADLTESFLKGIEEMYGTQEGLEAMLVGGIVGGGMAFSRSTIRQDFKNRRNNAKHAADVINGGFFNKSETEGQNLNAMALLVKEMEAARKSGDIKRFKDAQYSLIQIQAMQALDNGTLEVYKQRLKDSKELSDEEFAKLFEFDPSKSIQEQTKSEENKDGKTKSEVIDSYLEKIDQIEQSYDRVNELFPPGMKSSPVARMLMGKDARESEDKIARDRETVRKQLIISASDIINKNKRLDKIQEQMQTILANANKVNGIPMIEEDFNLRNVLTETVPTNIKDLDSKKRHKTAREKLVSIQEKLIQKVIQLQDLGATAELNKFNNAAKDYLEILENKLVATETYNKLASEDYFRDLFAADVKAKQDEAQKRAEEERAAQNIKEAKEAKDVKVSDDASQEVKNAADARRRKLKDLENKAKKFWLRRVDKYKTLDEKLADLKGIDPKGVENDAKRAGLAAAIKVLENQKKNTPEGKKKTELEPGSPVVADQENEAVVVEEVSLVENEDEAETLTIGDSNILLADGKMKTESKVPNTKDTTEQLDLFNQGAEKETPVSQGNLEIELASNPQGTIMITSPNGRRNSKIVVDDAGNPVVPEADTVTESVEKPRYSDNQVPVKTEEFTVYEEDGSVHAKFRAVTRLDGTVEWTQWSKAAERWVPAKVIDEKIQKRDNISNEEAIRGYTQATVRDAKTDKVIPSGMTYTVGKVGDYKTVMNPKMFDRLTPDQQQRVDPKRAKTKPSTTTKDILINQDILLDDNIIGTEVEFEIIENDWWKSGQGRRLSEEWMEIPIYVKIGNQYIGMLRASESTERQAIVNKLQKGDKVTTNISDVRASNYNNAINPDTNSVSFSDPRKVIGEDNDVLLVFSTISAESGIPSYSLGEVDPAKDKGDLVKIRSNVENMQDALVNQIGVVIKSKNSPEPFDKIAFLTTANLSEDAQLVALKALEKRDYDAIKEIVANSKSPTISANNNTSYLEVGKFGDTVNKETGEIIKPGLNYIVYWSNALGSLVRLNEVELVKAFNGDTAYYNEVEVNQDERYVVKKKGNTGVVDINFKQDLKDFLSRKKYNVRRDIANLNTPYTSLVTGKTYDGGYQDYLFSDSEIGGERSEGQGYNSILATDLVKRPESESLFHNPQVKFSKGNVLGETAPEIIKNTKMDKTTPEAPVTPDIQTVVYKGNTYSVDFNAGSITNTKTGKVLKGGVTSTIGSKIVDIAISQQEAPVSKNKSIEDLFDNLGGIDPNTGKPRKC